MKEAAIEELKVVKTELQILAELRMRNILLIDKELESQIRRYQKKTNLLTLFINDIPNFE